MLNWKTPLQEIKIGEGRVVKEGEKVAILSLGHPGNFVVKAQEKFEKEGLNIAHYDLRFAKPLDDKLLHSIFEKFENGHAQNPEISL